MTLPVDLTDKLNAPVDTVIVGQITTVNDWGYGLSTEKLISQFPTPTVTLHNSEADANNNVNGTAVSLVTTVPADGQLRVWYTNETGKIGFVEANFAQNGKWLRISCQTYGDLWGSKKANAVHGILNDHEIRLVEAEEAIANVNLGSPDSVSSFRAYQMVQQSFNATEWTKVHFETQEYDNLDEYDIATYKFTASAAGIYMLSTAVRLASQVDGNRIMLAVYKNGSSAATLYDGKTGAAGDGAASGATILKLNTGDTVEIYILTSNACSTPATLVPSWVFFTMCRIA